MDIPASNKVILYYSHSCGHCIRFIPDWEKLKGKLKKENWEQYEETENPTIIRQDHIEAFPTIKIIIGGVSTEYKGKRTAEDILKVLSGQTSESNQSGSSLDINKIIQEEFHQCGGSHCSINQSGSGKKDLVEFYKMKYLKYKAKYMKLKG